MDVAPRGLPSAVVLSLAFTAALAAGAGARSGAGLHAADGVSVVVENKTIPQVDYEPYLYPCTCIATWQCWLSARGRRWFAGWAHCSVAVVLSLCW